MTTNNTNKRYSIYRSSRPYKERHAMIIEKYGEKFLDEVIGNAITTMFETIHENIVKTDHDDSMIDTDVIVIQVLEYIWDNDEELQERWNED